MLQRLLGSHNSVFRRAYSAQALQCWKCEHTNELKPSTRFCDHCNIIQPLSPHADYFAYLDLDRRYDVAQNELKARFRRVQAHVHPDKYGGEERRAQELSEQHSSYLNQAYNTLRDSRRRARYLLKLITNESTEEETGADMAAEMFDLMSELETLTDAQSLKKKAEEIDAQVETLLKQVERAFANSDMTAARSILNQLRYYDRAKKIVVQHNN